MKKVTFEDTSVSQQQQSQSQSQSLQVHSNPTFPLLLSTVASIESIITASCGIMDPARTYKDLVPDEFLPGCLSQDIVSLIVAISLWPTSIWFWRKRSIRPAVLWFGMVDYLLYAYGIYTFEAVVNDLYLLYVSIFCACIWSIIFLFSGLSFDALGMMKVHEHAALPKRELVALFAILGTLFPIMWVAQLIPAMASRTAPTGISIMVMDLAFNVPSLFICIWLLLRDKPILYVVVPAIAIKAGILGTSVLLGALLQPLFGKPMLWNEVFVYTLLGPCSLAVAAKTWLCLPKDPSCTGTMERVGGKKIYMAQKKIWELYRKYQRLPFVRLFWQNATRNILLTICMFRFHRDTLIIRTINERVVKRRRKRNDRQQQKQQQQDRKREADGDEEGDHIVTKSCWESVLADQSMNTVDTSSYSF